MTLAMRWFVFIALGGLTPTVDAVCAATARKPARAPSSLKVETGARGSVAIFSDNVPGFDRQLATDLATRLRSRGFGVTELSATQVSDPTVLSTANFFLYVIPNGRTYPAEGIKPLVAFARDRGHLLVLGGPLLDNPVWPHDGRWLNRQDVREAMQNAKPRHYPLGHEKLSVDGWTRTCGDRKVPGSWEIVSDGPGHEPCFKFWTKNFIGWDGYASSTIKQLFGEQHDLFSFLAKGSPRTTQLAVEIQEQDGSRWFATVDIGVKWQRIALRPNDFRYWRDSSTRGQRGRAGDKLRPQYARRVIFQLANSHTTAVPSGPHTFWVADIGTCVDPVASMQWPNAASTTSLESLFPRYKVFRLQEPLTLKPAGQQHVLTGAAWPAPNDTVCAIPRTMGRGFARDQKWRYVPLLDATDATGHRSSTREWLAPFVSNTTRWHVPMMRRNDMWCTFQITMTPTW